MSEIGRKRIKVRVHRTKTDDDGSKIEHQHRHHDHSSKIYLHKNGIVAPESIAPLSTGDKTLEELNSSDLETINFLEKSSKTYKKSHQRYEHPRTKVNRATAKNAFEDSDDDKTFTVLEEDFKPKFVGYSSKFAGKGVYDTTTIASSTTIDTRSTTSSYSNVVTRDLNAPTTTQTTHDDVTGAPRTSQSFTSFVGESLAEDTTKITDTSVTPDSEMYIAKEIKKVAPDPFGIVDEEFDYQKLYPSNRRQPTHSFDSSELKDPFDFVYNREITSINDELEVEEYKDYARRATGQKLKIFKTIKENSN